MNNKKYDHVGRPTNEEVKKYRNKKNLKILLIIFVLFIFGGGLFLLFNYESLDFSSLMGNSATNTNAISKISRNPVYSLYTGNYDANALQGSVGVNNSIYFALVDSSSNNKSSFKTTAYSYNMNNKTLNKLNDVNQLLTNYPKFKNNDIVYNSKTKQIHLVQYDGHYYKQNTVLFGQNNNNIKIDQKIVNLGYSSSAKKYVSVTKDKVYFYTLDNNKLNVNTICNLDDSLKDVGSKKTVLQGITVLGNNLYVAYQTNTKNNSGKIVQYNNHINLYDLRNCTLQEKKINLSRKYDLGYNSKKYELESIFFMNNKFYLGYNGQDFRNIYFYTFDISSSLNIVSTKIKNNNKVYIQSNITSSNNGVITYSVCKSKKASQCKFKHANAGGRYNIKFGNFRFKREVKEPGTYYVHLYDNFHNLKTSNPIVVEQSDIVGVNKVKLNKSKGTLYLNNKNNTVKLTATVEPTNATNTSISWFSSDESVATVSKDGIVKAVGLGNAKITAYSANKSVSSTYNLTVKQKNIIVITASLGVRMNAYYSSYESDNTLYKKDDNTLKYVFKSGSGFDFQYGDGLNTAIEFLNSSYTNKKDFIDLNVFFSLTGNEVRTLNCDQIQDTSDSTNNIYVKYATKYKESIQKIIDNGFKNTKGYIISHSPLNSKHPLASKNKIVYSTNDKYCDSGYRSSWKYLISNRRMESELNTGNYGDITFLDYFGEFLEVKDENARTFNWKIQPYTTPENDALHWDEPTTKKAMKVIFDLADL